jgi:hypothetical protein
MQVLLRPPEQKHQHQDEQDEHQARQCGIGFGVMHGFERAPVRHAVELADRLHDSRLGGVVGIVVQHAHGFGAAGGGRRFGGFDQCHRGELGARERIRIGLGLRQLGEFLGGEAGLAHQFQQGHRRFRRARPSVVLPHEIPIDVLIFGRTGLAAVADVENFLVVPLVDRIAGHRIGADHARQIVRGLAQFVGEEEGCCRSSLARSMRFSAWTKRRKLRRSGEHDCRQQVAREPRGAAAVVIVSISVGVGIAVGGRSLQPL